MKSTQRLGSFDLTMIVVSLVIGMGIFRTPVNVAAASSTPVLFFLAWLVGGMVALCGALTYAEIGSRYPVTGGYYKIFSYCYHPALAFMINGIILISNAASMSAVALIGAEYINKIIFPVAMQTPAIRQIIAIISILVFYTINLLGLKVSARTQNILTLIKILMVSILVFSIFSKSSVNDPFAVIHIKQGWSGALKAFGVALIAVSFTYGGYQQTINFGGEADQPQKKIPRGIFAGLFIIILLYMLINFAYVKVIGFEQLKHSRAIAALLAGALFGQAGDTVFRVLLFFSVLAYVNVLLLSNPRVIYAMADDGALPAFFLRKQKKTEVLSTALSCFAAVSICTLFFSSTFDRILNYTIFLDSIGMATSAATIFILRKKTRHLDGSGIYKMRLYPFLPIIFIAAYIGVCASIIHNDPQAALYGFIIFVLFFPLYKIFSANLAKRSQ